MSEPGQDDNPSNGSNLHNEAEMIGRIIQSEQKLSDYFTTIIAKSVTDQLDMRNIIRLRVIGVVSVLLMSFAIPATMSWIRGSIAAQTEVAIGEEFVAASADLESRFEGFLHQERMYSSFTNYLLYLSDRSSVPSGELASVRIRLEEFADQKEIINRSEFPNLLDLVTRLAVKHNDKALLELLETEFAASLTAPRTMPRLTRYYGERVLGDHFSSETRRRAAANRFEQYLDAAELSPNFEALLPLQLMVDNQFSRGDGNDADAIIRLHVRDMGPQDQAHFIAETVRYSNPQFWEAPMTARTRRIAVIAGRVVIDQRDFYIHLLDNVAVQTALIDIAESEANKGNQAFATALSGFRNAFSGELDSTDDAAFRAAILLLISSDLSTWMHDEVIITALRLQNLETQAVSHENIQALDSQWNAEFESGAYDLIEGVMERTISRLLRRVKRDSFGMYREIFVMDGRGLIVGASDPNSDYWQGEEDKWLKTFPVGAGAMHIGALKFDESALAWVVQISLPLLDPDQGTPIGAITIGVDPSMLEHSL